VPSSLTAIAEAAVVCVVALGNLKPPVVLSTTPPTASFDVLGATPIPTFCVVPLAFIASTVPASIITSPVPPTKVSPEK
jgi:hypothetical protein